MRKQTGKRPTRRDGLVNEASRKPAARARLMLLVVGNAYVTRKGSATRMMWGSQSVFVVLKVPQRCTTASIINVLGPNGMLLIEAGDLRPAIDNSETAE